MAKLVFSVSQSLDEGVAHPKVAQFGPGMMEIVDGTVLENSDKDALKQECIEITEFLIKAERLSKALVDDISSIEADFAANGPTYASDDGRVVNVPQSLLLNNARDALAYYRRILTRVARAIGSLYGEELNGPYLHKVANAVAANGGKENRLYQFIMETQPMVQYLLDELRNEDEHPSRLGPFIRPFAVKQAADDSISLIPPTFHNGDPVKEGLQEIDRAVYQIALMCFVFALGDRLQHFRAICHVPEDKRDPEMPIEMKLIVDPAQCPGVPVQVVPGYTIKWTIENASEESQGESAETALAAIRTPEDGGEGSGEP